MKKKTIVSALIISCLLSIGCGKKKGKEQNIIINNEVSPSIEVRTMTIDGLQFDVCSSDFNVDKQVNPNVYYPSSSSSMQRRFFSYSEENHCYSTEPFLYNFFYNDFNGVYRTYFNYNYSTDYEINFNTMPSYADTGMNYRMKTIPEVFEEQECGNSIDSLTYHNIFEQPALTVPVLELDKKHFFYKSNGFNYKVCVDTFNSYMPVASINVDSFNNIIKDNCDKDLILSTFYKEVNDEYSLCYGIETLHKSDGDYYRGIWICEKDGNQSSYIIEKSISNITMEDMIVILQRVKLSDEFKAELSLLEGTEHKLFNTKLHGLEMDIPVTLSEIYNEDGDYFAVCSQADFSFELHTYKKTESITEDFVITHPRYFEPGYYGYIFNQGESINSGELTWNKYTMDNLIENRRMSVLNLRGDNKETESQCGYYLTQRNPTLGIGLKFEDAASHDRYVYSYVSCNVYTCIYDDTYYVIVLKGRLDDSNYVNLIEEGLSKSFINKESYVPSEGFYIGQLVLILYGEEIHDRFNLDTDVMDRNMYYTYVKQDDGFSRMSDNIPPEIQRYLDSELERIAEEDAALEEESAEGTLQQ